MSTTVSFFEELHIGKDSPGSAEWIRRLSDYIRQYDEMMDIEDLNIAYLELVCGDERAEIRDLSDAEPDNTWLLTQNGFERQRGEHRLLEPGHPLIRLAGKMKPGQEIVFRMSASMTRAYTTDYTYRYWLATLEGITPEDLVDYRVAEAADTDETVFAFHLNGESTEEVPRDGSPDLVSDIPCWFSENFRLSISTDDEDLSDEFEKQIGGALQDVVDDLEDDFLEPDVYDGNAELAGSLELQADQLPVLMESLRNAAEAAGKLNAEIECIAEFLPVEAADNGIEPFAVLRIASKDGKIEMTACRFDR